MHSKHMIHRDIKAENVLITRDGQVKIIDFGWSIKLQPNKKCEDYEVGSPWWTAPEVIRHKRYDGKADIWSLGITVFELVQREEPFMKLDFEQVKIALKAGKRPPSTKMKIFDKLTQKFYRKATRQMLNGPSWISRPKVQDLAKHDLLKLADKSPNGFSTLRATVIALIDQNFAVLENLENDVNQRQGN